MYESLPSYMKEVKGVRVLWAQEYAPYVTIAEMYYEAVEAFDDSMKKFWWHTLVCKIHCLGPCFELAKYKSFSIFICLEDYVKWSNLISFYAKLFVFITQKVREPTHKVESQYNYKGTVQTSGSRNTNKLDVSCSISNFVFKVRRIYPALYPQSLLKSEEIRGLHALEKVIGSFFPFLSSAPSHDHFIVFMMKVS